MTLSVKERQYLDHVVTEVSYRAPGSCGDNIIYNIIIHNIIVFPMLSWVSSLSEACWEKEMS